MWQVQIFIDDVGEWYGWSGCELQETRAAANTEARTARRYGWKTRVVKVK